MTPGERQKNLTIAFIGFGVITILGMICLWLLVAALFISSIYLLKRKDILTGFTIMFIFIPMIIYMQLSPQAKDLHEDNIGDVTIKEIFTCN